MTCTARPSRTLIFNLIPILWLTISVHIWSFILVFIIHVNAGLTLSSSIISRFGRLTMTRWVFHFHSGVDHRLLIFVLHNWKSSYSAFSFISYWNLKDDHDDNHIEYEYCRRLHFNFCDNIYNCHKLLTITAGLSLWLLLSPYLLW